MAAKSKKPEFPEHEKLQKIANISNNQGAFLDWLREEGYVLAKWRTTRDGGGLWPAQISIPDLLANYHDIDQKKFEKEKRKMLDQIRNYNAKAPK